jgi:hypothetical protein
MVAVVGQKALIEKLKAASLPQNVETGNFGALAGLDRWKEAAGVIAGHPAAMSPAKGHFRWYER